MKTLLFITLLSLTIISTNTQAADEGIKVHGHWTFKIYNPDGSFDRKVEFENAIVFTGEEFLVNVLARSITTAKWALMLSSSTGNPCASTSGTPIEQPCTILEVGEAITNTDQFNNLLLSVETLPFGKSKFILAGSLVAANVINPSIDNVETRVWASNNVQYLFTEKAITSVSLFAGQIVQVTVEISFS